MNKATSMIELVDKDVRGSDKTGAMGMVACCCDI
jgi:hypothetical protein